MQTIHAFLVFSLTGSLFSGPAVAAICPDLLENFGVTRYENLLGETVPVLNVSSGVRERSTQDLKIVPIQQVLSGQDSIAIGVGRPNVFLLQPNGEGGYDKFSAKSFKRGVATFEDTKGFAQSGVWIIPRDIDATTIERLREASRRHAGERFWTCSNSVCQVLSDAGFTSTQGKPLTDLFMPDTLLRVLVRGDLQLGGKTVEFDVVRTTTDDLDAFNLELLKAEVTTPWRHLGRGWQSFLKKYKLAPYWVFAKDKANRARAFLYLGGEKPSAPTPQQKDLVKNLPGEQQYVADLHLSVSQTSRIGTLLRLAWGAHTLFEIRQDRVPVDEYLPEVKKAFDQAKPDLLTRLKQTFLFSKPVVSRIRQQLVANRLEIPARDDKQLYDQLRVHTEGKPNKYNLVITGDRIIMARVQVRHPYVDWILSKHVLVSGYDPDVRFAGEVWKTADGVIHVNMNSGTYRPVAAELEQAGRFLQAVFPAYRIQIEN